MGLLDRLRRSLTGAPSGRQQTSTPPTQRHTRAARHETPAAGQPHFAVIDVETTGLSPEQNRIIEIAVVTTDPTGRILDEWATRLNPQGPVGATHIHGITDADVAKAPLFTDVITDLNRQLAGAAIAAHHARFDLAFLRAEYSRAGWDLPHLPALCTLQASDYHLPTLDRRRLVDCCWAVGARLDNAHSALGDARATAALLAAFMNPGVGLPPLPEHLAMPATALNIVWPTVPARSPSNFVPASSRPAPSRRAQIVIAQEASVAPPPALVELVERFSLLDALDEGAPAGTLAYLEKLAEVLEDGEVTAEEAADLASVAEAEQLTSADIDAANQAFVLVLAHAALDDGKVTRAERTELQTISDLLGVNPKVIPALLERAEDARNQRLSAGLKELPADWAHGEPLRVGAKVVFTGCDDTLRDQLEERSEKLGVRIIGAISAKTTMLVTDGTMDGTKAAKARELGTRTIHPNTYAVLLDHLQPSRTRERSAQRRASVRTAATSAGDAAAEVGADAVAADPNPAEARVWARANGYDVGVRGRLQRDVVDAYIAAHAD